MTWPLWIKIVLSPGTIANLGACVAIWLILKYGWRRMRALARPWIICVGSFYILLSLPVVANAIIGGLPPQQAESAPAGTVNELVVFDGDNRVGRVRTADRAYRDSSPQTVVVLGEAWIADELVTGGVPRDRLEVVPIDGTTRTQIDWVARRQYERPADRVGLVASRLQMPRVAALAQAMGLNLVLLPSPIDAEPPTGGARLFVPSYVALRASRDAIYERAALAYYRWRGWIR